MPTIVYKYGCKAPRANCLQLVEEQFSQAHRYYNRMVELERDLAEKLEQLKRQYCQGLQEVVDQVARVDQEIADAIARANTAKMVARSKTAPLENRQEIVRLKEGRKACWEREKELRKKARENEQYKADVVRAVAEHNLAYKALYAEFSGLFWGTKNGIAESVERAKKTTKGGPLQFKRWSRDGRLYCQIMGGATAEEVFGLQDTRLQIEREPGHGKRATVRMRIGSNPDKSPIWAEMLTYIHRPLPEGARISGVSLVRRENVHHRKQGKYQPFDEWSICLTVQMPEQTRQNRFGTLAIDTGWRLVDGGLRVGYGVDEQGNHHELILPDYYMDTVRHIESMESIVSILFNDTLDALVEWLASRQNSLSEAMQETLRYLPQWRSRRRLYALCERWEAIDGDRDIRSMLEKWRERDTHIQQIITGERTKLVASRLDQYRVWAAKFSRKYGTIILEDIDIAAMRRNPLPEEESEDVVKRWRNLASIGLLRQCFRQCRHAGKVVLLNASNTTTTCSYCGSRERMDKRQLLHRCSHCDTEWDQDLNAARNLLRGFSESEGSTETPGGSRDPQGVGAVENVESASTPTWRFQRRKLSRSQRGTQNIAHQRDI